MPNQICEVCPHRANCYNVNTESASESFDCHDDGTFEPVAELDFTITEKRMRQSAMFHN